MDTPFYDYPAFPVQENEYLRKFAYEFNRWMLHFNDITSSIFINDKRILKALEYIEQHYQDTFSLGEVAQQVGLNENTLSKLFHRFCDFTFTEAVIKVRVAHAIALIRTTNQTLGVIAYDCGFTNNRSFTRLFRQTTGLTPAEFRKVSSLRILREEMMRKLPIHEFQQIGTKLTGNELNHYRLNVSELSEEYGRL